MLICLFFGHVFVTIPVILRPSLSFAAMYTQFFLCVCAIVGVCVPLKLSLLCAHNFFLSVHTVVGVCVPLKLSLLCAHDFFPVCVFAAVGVCVPFHPLPLLWCGTHPNGLLPHHLPQDLESTKERGRMAASGTLGLSTKCSQVVPMLVSKPEVCPLYHCTDCARLPVLFHAETLILRTMAAGSPRRAKKACTAEEQEAMVHRLSGCVSFLLWGYLKFGIAASGDSKNFAPACFHWHWPRTLHPRGTVLLHVTSSPVHNPTLFSGRTGKPLFCDFSHSQTSVLSLVRCFLLLCTLAATVYHMYCTSVIRLALIDHEPSHRTGGSAHPGELLKDSHHS